MRFRVIVRVTGIVLGLMVVASASPLVAYGAAPANDSFAGAAVVGSLPFSGTVNVTEATTEPGEPQFCSFTPHTVWYSITPAVDAVLRADLAGSSVTAGELNVYRAVGSGFDGLSFMGCASFVGSVLFSVQAGMTYYLQAGDIFFGGGGDLVVNVQQLASPADDDFERAKPIATLPFSDTADTTAATVQAGEPTPSCTQGFLESTVWYAFTPASSGSVLADASGAFSPLVAAYTGSSLGSLTELACHALGGPVLNVHVTAGTTYYFQAGGYLGGRGTLTFTLQVTPPPQAAFAFSPNPPSIFEPTQFFDVSTDPAQVGIQLEEWDFGDGATATGCCPTHRYAADGDYTVHLKVTTLDGRSGSTSGPVHVATHDVAITKLTFPTSASTGQTRQISVGIKNNHYPENVLVQLFKSYPVFGFALIDNLTQPVPVRPSNRTTSIDFNYTFTSDDAIIGKVTFKVVAYLLDARDASPADNEATASPTKINR